MIELNKMSTMEAKLDALMHRLDKRLHSAIVVGAVEREERVRNVEGLLKRVPMQWRRLTI